MKPSTLSRSSRQLRRVVQRSMKRTPPFGHVWRPSTSPTLGLQYRSATTLSYSTGPSFSGFYEPPIDVAPVVEDAREEDVNNEVLSKEEPRVVRIMSPTESSLYSTTMTTATVVEENYEQVYDQDYDRDNLHMSSFQAYNTTYESLENLEMTQHDDVINLGLLEKYWEAHPTAFSDQLPTVEMAHGHIPDVKDN